MKFRDSKNFDNRLEAKVNRTSQSLEPVIGKTESSTTDEILTKKDCMEILKCSERTLRYYLHEKKLLQYFKVGKGVRIKRLELDKFIESLQQSSLFHH